MAASGACSAGSERLNVRFVAILNPASCSGKSAKVKSRVAELASRDGIEVIKTERAGHATEIARSLARVGVERVIAVGGDGTLNEVANGLAKSETAMAAVPAGTGNDWVRTVAIPSDTNVAWHIATHGKTTQTDLAEVEGHRYCLNVLGAGFDAEVARRISESRGLVGALGPTPKYIAAVLGTFASTKRPTLSISLDGRETKVVPRALLVAVGVAQYYGSGMHILPHAKIDDGLLDVVWGARIKAPELPGILKMLYKGTVEHHAKVTTDRCKFIQIESDQPTPFHIDGDVCGTLPINVYVRPNALKIVVP